MEQIIVLAKAIKELSTSTLLIAVSPLLLMIALMTWQSWEMQKLFMTIAATAEQQVEQRRTHNATIIKITESMNKTQESDARVDAALLEWLRRSK